MKHKLVDFIIQFMEEVDKEISEMKLFVGSIVPPRHNQHTAYPIVVRVKEEADVTTVECKSPLCCRIILDPGSSILVLSSQ